MDELIRREVSRMLLTYFPDEIVSITQLHVSKDLAFAKVWISAFRDIDEVAKEAQTFAAVMRKQLSEKVVARKVPKLFFVADKTEEKAAHIDQLFEQLKKEQK